MPVSDYKFLSPLNLNSVLSPLESAVSCFHSVNASVLVTVSVDRGVHLRRHKHIFCSLKSDSVSEDDKA